MADSQKQLDIKVTATDEASAVIDRVKEKAKKPVGDQQEKASSYTEVLAKQFAWTSAASEALSVMTISSDMLKGNFESAAEAAKKLPLGIGEAAGILEKVLGQVTGWADETEMAKRETDVMNTAMAAQVSLAQQAKEHHKDMVNTIREIANELAKVGKNAQTVKLIDIDQGLEKRLKDIEEKLQKFKQETGQTTKEANQRMSEQMNKNAPSPVLDIIDKPTDNYQKVLSFAFNQIAERNPILKYVLDDARETEKKKAEEHGRTMQQISNLNIRRSQETEKAGVEAEEAKTKAIELAGKQRQDAMKKAQIEIDNASRESAAKTRESLNSAAEQNLRAQGKNNEAELLRLRQDADKRLAEIEKNRKARIKEVADSPDKEKQIKQIEQDAKNEGYAVESDTYAKTVAMKRKQELEDAEKHETVRKTIAQSRIEQLKNETLAEDALGQVRVKQLEIDEQRKQKAFELNKIINDRGTYTDAEKAAAAAQLANLNKSSSMAMAKAAYGEFQAAPALSIQASRFSSGASDYAREKMAGDDQRQHIANIKEMAERIANSIEEIQKTFAEGKIVVVGAQIGK